MLSFLGPSDPDLALGLFRRRLPATGLSLFGEWPTAADRLFLLLPPPELLECALATEPEIMVHLPHHLLVRPRPGATLFLTPKPTRLWASFHSPELDALAARLETALRGLLEAIVPGETTSLLADYIDRHGPCRPDGRC